MPWQLQWFMQRWNSNINIFGLTWNNSLAKLKGRFSIFGLFVLLIFDHQDGWPMFQREVTIGWVGTINTVFSTFDVFLRLHFRGKWVYDCTPLTFLNLSNWPCVCRNFVRCVLRLWLNVCTVPDRVKYSTVLAEEYRIVTEKIDNWRTRQNQ